MCLFCGSKPFGFTAASLTRRNFVSSSIALVGMYASAKTIDPIAAAAQDSKADWIIENAKIITLDEKTPRAQAIAIAGDKVVGVGARRDLERLKSPSTKIIDAGGRTIVPGLNDAHTHFIRGGLTYSQEVRWDGVPSLALALRMLKEQAQRTPAPHWVQVVGGWTPYQFKEKRLPTLDDINAACGDVPCFVMHLYDRALINKAGLRALGWNRDTPDPMGGVIARAGNGEPTGLLIATTSLISLLGVFAKIPKLSADDQVISTRHMMRELNRLGVTSLIDAGGGGQNYPEHYQAIAKLAADKALTVRIGYTLMAQRPGREIEDYKGWLSQAKLYQGDDYFRLCGAGEYTVWAAGDVTNFAKDPLPQPPIMEEKLAEVLTFVVSKGWPFRMHASFDFTAQRILGVVEKVHKETPVDQLRWGLEHCEGMTARTLERLQALGGSLGLQNRMSADGEAYVAKWGKEAAEDAPAFGRIKQMGVPFALGTDGNRAASHNPWVGIQWLVTGKTQGGLRHAADRNLMGREEALRSYSAAGAWMSHEADKKGTLSVGKWADLAILNGDYLNVPEDRISRLSAVLTMVGGKVVYGEGRYASLAPPTLKVSPDWLPISRYPGYAKSASIETGGRLAAALNQGVPTVIGEDGRSWTLGCGCGLL
ncbi:MAG TPA: amidohydrolase [Xanthobacteraceae bacterium]|nr:amidohydrolase [Xanthobacteraceae bacterium]